MTSAPAGAAIVVVCLNPAVDLSYRVPQLCHGRTHRVAAAHSRAGGKALNVARVLKQLEVPARVLSFAGRDTGEQIRSDLRAAKITAEFLPCAEASRHTVTVVDHEDATVFNELGPTLSADEWDTLVAAYRAALPGAHSVVLAGSVPPGAPADAYYQLVGLAVAVGLPCILDAAGDQLARALPARPTIVKPNRHEAAEVLGEPLDDIAGVVRAAEQLRRLGAEAAVISCGAAGFVAANGQRTWRAWLGEHLSGNPTGAGDALTAALAAGLFRGLPWPELLREGIAFSAAAVVKELAGEVDLATAERLRPLASTQELR